MSYGKVNKTTGERIPYAGNGSAGIDTTYTLSVGTGADADKIVLTPSTGNPDKVTVPYATNSGTVNGKTVAENVPSGAVFTDTTDADDLNYDNTDSGLSATKVQGAIDEVNSKVGDLRDDVTDVIGWDRNPNIADINKAIPIVYQSTDDKVSITVNNNDMRVVVNGALYSGAQIILDNIDNGNYTLSCSWTFNTAGSTSVQAFNSSDTRIYDSGIKSADGNITRTITVSDNYIKLVFFGSWGSNTGDVTFSNIQLEEGATATPYEPYHPVIGEAVKAVKLNTQDLTTASRSKNVFDKNSVEIGYLVPETGEITPSTSWRISNYIMVNAGENYVMSGITHLSPSNHSVGFYDSSKAFVSAISLSSSQMTFTVPSGISFVRIDMRTDDINTAQLEKGNTATSFVPYIPSVESRLESVESGLTNLGNIKAITLSSHGTIDINIRNIAFVLYCASNSEPLMDTVSASVGYLDTILGDKTSSKKFTYTKVSDGVITVTNAVNWAVTAIILN